MNTTNPRKVYDCKVVGDVGGPCWTWLIFAIIFTFSILLGITIICLTILFCAPPLVERLIFPSSQISLDKAHDSSYPKRPIYALFRQTKSQSPLSLPVISDAEIVEAYIVATNEISAGRYAEANKKAGCPFNFAHSSSPNKRSVPAMDIKALALEGEIQERTAFIIKHKYGIGHHHMAALRNVSAGSSNKPCVKKMQSLDHRGNNCTRNWKYRSYDGVCNNLRYPLRGATATTYTRGLPAAYSDVSLIEGASEWAQKFYSSTVYIGNGKPIRRISAPRVSIEGGRPLPQVRTLSNKFFAMKNANRSKIYSTLINSFGQFLTHDVLSTPTALRADDCCSNRMNASECLPLEISEYDKYYSKFHVRCVSLTRAQAAPHPDCSLGPRDHINLATSFLDCSSLYGFSAEEMAKLRSFKRGQLKASFVDGAMSLPITTKDIKECTQDTAKPMCFILGDSRSHQNLGVLSMHELWLREHNRLGSLLSVLNPSWDDERLFEEARRITIAEFQHVSFSEYLPLVIGKQKMIELGLQPLNSSYFKDYSEEVNPSLDNEFVAGAFRFAHSATPNEWHFVSDRKVWDMKTHEGMFLPSLFVRDNVTLASFLLGSSVQSTLDVGPLYSEEMINHLFEMKTAGYGYDLASIDVLRGRDQGLKSYNEFREYCNLHRLNSFGELKRVFTDNVARSLKKLYRNVDDIDLLVGGLSERPLPGSQMGPLFTCMLAKQFARLRCGDRFWYENGPGSSPYPFTPRQLDQIRRVSLARLICDNEPNIGVLSPNMFKLPSKENVQVSCHSAGQIPALDIKLWKEKSQGTNPNDIN